MLRKSLLLLLPLLLFSPASAQQVSIRNHAFKGATSGSGAALMVGLKDIAAAVDLQVQESNGGFVIGDHGSAEVKAGEVLVNGKVVPSEAQADGPLVNLKEFCAAAALVYRPNKTLNTIDIFLATKPVASTPGSTGASGIMELNRFTPENIVDLRSLPETGKYTFIFIYRDGGLNAQGQKVDGYPAITSKIDAFGKYPEVLLYKVNVGPGSGPMCQKYQFPGCPGLYVFNPARRYVGGAFGHSIIPLTQNPDKYMKEIHTAAPSEDQPW